MNRREFGRLLALRSGGLSALTAAPAVGLFAAATPAAAAVPEPELLEGTHLRPTTPSAAAERIEISFQNGGRFVAQLFLEEAPDTCRYFLERLPFTLPARRSVMSGGIVGVNLEGWNFNKLEYVNTMLPEGEIGFLTTFLPHRPMNNPYCQLLFPLGERTMIHQMWGTASPTNRMAKIVEGGLAEMRAIGARIADRGPEQITVKRLPS